MARQYASQFNTSGNRKLTLDPCADSPSGAHRWLLESPTDGSGTVPGACLVCGKERTFASGFTEKQWNTRIAKQISTEIRNAVSE